jgi:hypothetical protein
MRLFIVALFALCIAVPALAVDDLPILNPKSGGTTTFKVNDGGTIKDVLKIDPMNGISGGGFAARNELINGNMDFCQRSCNLTSTAPNGYLTFDRWATGVALAGSRTISQQTLTDGEVVGSRYFMRRLKGQGSTNTDGTTVYQYIETANTMRMIGKSSP